MKKNLLSATALALAISAGTAFAADLPSHKAPPYIPPPPLMTWTGFYVGVNAGGTFGGSNSIWTSVAPFALGGGASVGAAGLIPHAAASALAGSSIASRGVSGFIGGGQIGYNWQFGGRYVVGVEADIQGVVGGRGTANGIGVAPVIPGAPPHFYLSFNQASKSLDYLGTVRGRAGFLFTPNLLVYATGGLAYGGVNVRNSIFQAHFVGGAPLATLPNFGTSSAFSNTRAGWTVGGGGEWMFAPKWSAKVEYLYYNLGSVATNSLLVQPDLADPTGLLFASAVQTRTRFDGHIVRAGINYHFWSAPPPAVYAKY